LKEKRQETLKSRLLAQLPRSPQIPSSFLLEGREEVRNPPTSQKGDAVAVARSTATRIALQLKLVKSPSQIFFYCHRIGKICRSHQLIQRLCLKGRKKRHSCPSSRWCERRRAHCWHSWRAKWRSCGTRSPTGISLNLTNSKAAMSGMLLGTLPLVCNTKAVANAQQNTTATPLVNGRAKCHRSFIKSFLIQFPDIDTFRSDLLKLTYPERSLTLI